MRIVVLGGGFGGVTPYDTREGLAAAHKCRDHSREPRELLRAHAAAVRGMLGRLELRHCAQPIRAALRRARFIEATVESVEVRTTASPFEPWLSSGAAELSRRVRPAVRLF